MTNKNVLVAGASIAGPALAWWLNKYGFKVTVVERSPTLRPGGYRVDIRGTSCSVMQKMGLWKEVEKYATQMRGSSMIKANGDVKMDLEKGVIGFHESTDREILRADFAKLLYDATKNDVEYIFDNKITAVAETSAGVNVTFAKGESKTFDLVIAADGIYSTTRDVIFGKDTSIFKHLHYFIAVFPIDNYLKLSNWEQMYITAGKMVDIFNVFDKETKAMFLFQSNQPSDGFIDPAKAKQLLRDTFKGEGVAIENLLNYIDKTDEFYFSPIDQVKMPKWSKGRCALVGDAAYCPSPASGQGASMALVGAYILAGELATSNGDYQKAFDSYEQQMRPFVAGNHKIGEKAVTDMIPSTKFKAWYQNALLSLMLTFMSKEKAMKMMLDNKEVNEVANSIKLKEYKALLG